MAAWNKMIPGLMGLAWRKSRLLRFYSWSIGVMLMAMLCFVISVLIHTSASKRQNDSANESTAAAEQPEQSHSAERAAKPPTQQWTFPLYFDKPLRVEHLHLPAAEDGSYQEGMRSCYYYPHFMVKEIDASDNIGSLYMSVTQIPMDGGEVECAQKQNSEEHVIKSGSFIGARANFPFFDTAYEGDGNEFDAYNDHGEKLFTDLCASFGKITARLIPSATRRVDAEHSSADIELSYDRVYLSQCSFGDNNHSCWTKAMNETGLTDTFSMDCATANVITYRVKIELSAKSIGAKAVPVSNVTSCYAGE
jgi:hypothetical protein